MILEVSIASHLDRLVDGESNSRLLGAPPGRTVSRSRRSQGRFEGGVGRRGGERSKGWSDTTVGGGEGRERSIEVGGGGRTDERVRRGEGNLTEWRGSNRSWGRSRGDSEGLRDAIQREEKVSSRTEGRKMTEEGRRVVLTVADLDAFLDSIDGEDDRRDDGPNFNFSFLLAVLEGDYFLLSALLFFLRLVLVQGESCDHEKLLRLFGKCFAVSDVGFDSFDRLRRTKEEERSVQREMLLDVVRARKVEEEKRSGNQPRLETLQ